MRLVAALVLLVAVPRASAPAQAPASLSDSAFASLSARLSEPGGYFDTDNLISNESSYLHALDALRQLGTEGGAYLGVGPDQNFSYIAALRPRVAFIIDIRRDNLLELLLYKALFTLAGSRVEYLCLLLGRPVPPDTAGWAAAGVDELVRYVDATPARPAVADSARARVRQAVRRFAIPLSEADLQTIARFHSAFIQAGLDLKMTTFNRPTRYDYPDYRRLLLERNRSGRRANYLADDDRFRYLQAMQARNLIVPVVGNLAGDRALAAIGEQLRRWGERVSALYASNVEFYLLGDGSFPAYVRNVRRLPRDGRSAIIRSYFSQGRPHPQSVGGYNSVQVVQTIEGLLRAQDASPYQSYYDLTTRETVVPR